MSYVKHTKIDLKAHLIFMEDNALEVCYRIRLKKVDQSRHAKLLPKLISGQLRIPDAERILSPDL